MSVDVARPIAPANAAPKRQGLAGALLRLTGELLMTVGVVILLFAVYELYGTGLTTAREQSRLERQLAQNWAAAPPAAARPAQVAPPVQRPALGGPAAVLTIPRLGEDYRHVVVEGVARDELKKGPGHQPGTAWPGQVGNVVLAGHRTTYGAPFGRFDEIAPGDEVLLTDATGAYTYRISGSEIVDPSDTAVTLPAPRQPGAEPTRRLLTLITCTPKYSAKYRLIISAEMVSRADRPTP